MTTYLYSIANDFSNGVNSEALADELSEDFGFGGVVEGITTDGDVCLVYMANVLAQAQKATLDLAVSQHSGLAKPFEKKHYEEEYDGQRIVRETWWARRAQDGTLSKKVEETTYAYDVADRRTRLLVEAVATYDKSGAVVKVRKWQYKTVRNGSQTIVQKLEV